MSFSWVCAVALHRYKTVKEAGSLFFQWYRYVERRFFSSGAHCRCQSKMLQPLTTVADDQESVSVVVDQVLPPQTLKKASIPGMIEEESVETDDSALTRSEDKATMDLQKSVLVNGRYQCPWPTWKPPTFINVLKFASSKDNSNIPSKTKLDETLPVIEPDFDSIPETGISLTWIGHATTLVKFDGITVLTDPIFSNRCSPVQLMGPKRYRPPPCTIQDLPLVDAVVISHNHYDHLDAGSVKQLNDRFGSDLRWFVPMKLGSWMQSMGCSNIVELDWWQSESLMPEMNIEVVCTPAQHWSKRTLLNDYKTLWGSWCIIGPKHRFFFAGDTGYCDVFKQIGKKYGPFDLAAIPIGAYEPRWFMKYQHVNPDDAVQIHEDVFSKHSIGIHWGTFPLANEFYLAPPEDLLESLQRRNISREHFITLHHGETHHLADTAS